MTNRATTARNQFDPDALNNQFGAGSLFGLSSPNYPYGRGWRIENGKSGVG